MHLLKINMLSLSNSSNLINNLLYFLNRSPYFIICNVQSFDLVIIKSIFLILTDLHVN